MAAVLLCHQYAPAQVQYPRFDTLMTVGKAGFRLYCRNKDFGQNQIRIRPFGFESTARELNFYIKGFIYAAMVDDLNNDGYPDMVLFIKTDSSGIFGTVYAFSSDQNKSIVPIPMPDIQLDGKLDQGYKGHDEFSLMEGTIMRKFPVYKAGDESNNPTGGRRAIQYIIVGKAESGIKFKVVQSFELK